MKSAVGKSKDDIKKHRIGKKFRLPITIAIAIVMWLISMLHFFSVNDIEPIEFFPISDYIESDVYRIDGTTGHYIYTGFDRLSKGDRIVARVHFPEEINIESPELYIPLYNCIVNVYLDGEPIYEDDYDPDNLSEHYGGRIYEIILPDGFEDKELTIDITPVVRFSQSDFNKMGIVKSNESWKMKIAGHGFIFSISLSIMIMAVICIFYFVVKSISRRELQIGLPVAIFELLINAWFFGSLGMFGLILGNQDICGKIEYYALYPAAIPLAIFIYMVLDSPIYKKIIKLLLIIYCVFYVVATVIELSDIQLNYSDMLSNMHLLSGFIILMLVISIFAGTKRGSNNYIFILRSGVLISMICGIIELVRFNITRYFTNKTWFSNAGVSYIAIMVIAVSLILYLISISAEEYTMKVERKQLMVLAYKDALTEMPNRAECYRKIEEMEAGNIKDYTMIFIDLNNLKHANDVYGHDMGDRLLKITAENIKSIFSENGFCSRWGGDEFVACIYAGKEAALRKIDEFLALMKKEDEAGSFPFEVSAACGYKCCTEAEYLPPMECIRLADAMMYENKKAMKAKR